MKHYRNVLALLQHLCLLPALLALTIGRIRIGSRAAKRPSH